MSPVDSQEGDDEHSREACRTVRAEKLVDYLLSKSHPIGHSKARFFESKGFTAANAKLLEQELLRIAYVEEVSSTETTSHSVKYILLGILTPVVGKAARIVTIWIIEYDDDRPRLVTAYPA
jgi:hypothetical protein